MSDCQLAILQDVPARGRYVFFSMSSRHRDVVQQSLMRHMLGLDDGIVDALFGISRPVTGANFWCPPMRHGQLDLRQLGC